MLKTRKWPLFELFLQIMVMLIGVANWGLTTITNHNNSKRRLRQALKSS